MASSPPDDDGPDEDPEARFLTELWGHLEDALEIATQADVISRLDDVLRSCEAAVEAIRVRQAASRS